MEETHYEMLWDCGYCGTEKLLGVSQKFCPNCGSPQNAENRYFPKDEDKVAVADHKYMGADRQCSACETPNAAIAKHCINCGKPMDGDAEVHRVTEQSQQAAPPPPAEPKKSSPVGMIILAVVVVVGLFFCLGNSCSKDAQVSVTGHSWSQVLTVEEYKKVKEEDWKSKVPSGAKDISCKDKKKGSKEVDSGKKTCTKKQIDKGDGSFIEKEKCKPVMIKQDILKPYCSYTIKKWTKLKDHKTEGKDMNPKPPVVNVKTCSKVKKGCQRAGKVKETYTVSFTSSEDTSKRYTCDLSKDIWKSFKVGDVMDAKVSMMGNLDCGSLKKK